VPDDEVLETLAGEFTLDWLALGRRLQFRDTKLEAFDKENDKCSEKAFKMLLRWKHKNGSRATYEVLNNALCHNLVNRVDLAEEYCRDSRRWRSSSQLSRIEIKNE